MSPVEAAQGTGGVWPAEGWPSENSSVPWALDLGNLGASIRSVHGDRDVPSASGDKRGDSPWSNQGSHLLQPQVSNFSILGLLYPSLWRVPDNVSLCGL